MLALLALLITSSPANVKPAPPPAPDHVDAKLTLEQPLLEPPRTTAQRLEGMGATQLDLHTAPILPKWPDDAPVPVQVDGGWLVPEQTAQLLIRDALYYPVACQAAMDAQHEYFDDRLKINLDLNAANEASHVAEVEASDRKGWRWYQVTALVLGTAAGSFALGYLYRDLHHHDAQSN